MGDASLIRLVLSGCDWPGADLTEHGSAANQRIVTSVRGTPDERIITGCLVNWTNAGVLVLIDDRDRIESGSRLP
jgi:hypothetical protein